MCDSMLTSVGVWPTELTAFMKRLTSLFNFLIIAFCHGALFDDDDTMMMMMIATGSTCGMRPVS